MQLMALAHATRTLWRASEALLGAVARVIFGKRLPEVVHVRWPHGDRALEEEIGMRIEDITEEQAAQFQACKTYEEFMAYASEVGLELDEAQAEDLRLALEDPEALKARLGQAFEPEDDADISEEESKAIVGGVVTEEERAWWVHIGALISPSAVTWKVWKIHEKYMNVW